jgi:hypothetical protein
MKTAGLALDFYDDQRGETLKSYFPEVNDLPEVIKTAHILRPEERDVLRDEAFALILHNDGHQLRKFACVDAGNTMLSTLYFLENYDSLPIEAVKVAAANLIAMNDEFGLPIPEELILAMDTGMTVKTSASEDAAFEKMPPKKRSKHANHQTGMSRTRDTLNQPFVGDEADWAQRTDLNKTMVGGQDSGRVTESMNTMKTAGFMDAFKKTTPTVRLSTLGKLFKRPRQAFVGAAQRSFRGDEAGVERGLTGAKKALERSKVHPVVKDGEFTQHLRTQKGIHGVATALGTKAGTWFRENQDKLKQSNVVDVSNLEPEAFTVNKKAGLNALGDKYSLDSYTDVQTAIQFFSDSWTEMSPASRHEFAVKTANRADSLGIEVPEQMLRYGGTEYSPDVEAHLANRRAVRPEYKDLWDGFSEKQASVDPETFAELLAAADKATGLDFEWGGAVMDPYYAVFGGRSETEKVAWAWASADGQELTEEGLKSISSEKLGEIFDSGVASAFAADPTTIFDSMPDEQKRIIANLAKV